MEDDEPSQDIAAIEGPQAKGAMAKFGPLIFGVALLLSCAGAFIGGGYLSLGPEGVQELFGEEEEEVAEDGEPVAAPTTYEWVNIEKTIYQLNRREESNYVLASFTIRTPSDRAEEVRDRLPEVQFALQTYIRELGPRELQGAMGLYNLRRACLFRARRILGEEAVADILIDEFLVE
ncbi:MAG: flagellar basal body-associated FliL family protein [Pseudomonadota bacterium]